MTKPEFYIYLVNALKKKDFTDTVMKKYHPDLLRKYRRLIQAAKSENPMHFPSDEALKELANLIHMEIEIQTIVLVTKSMKSTSKNWLQEIIDSSVKEAVEKIMEIRKDNKPEKRYLSIADITTLLGYKSKDTVYKRYYNNEMPPKLPGRRLLWKKTDITEWIEAGQPKNRNGD